jgi:hypothetical protein
VRPPPPPRRHRSAWAPPPVAVGQQPLAATGRSRACGGGRPAAPVGAIAACLGAQPGFPRPPSGCAGVRAAGADLPRRRGRGPRGRLGRRTPAAASNRPITKKRLATPSLRPHRSAQGLPLARPKDVAHATEYARAAAWGTRSPSQVRTSLVGASARAEPDDAATHQVRCSGTDHNSSIPSTLSLQAF